MRKPREGDGHVVADVPGKVALLIVDPEAGECLGYFPRERRPRVGARIGARGEYVLVEVPPGALTPEQRAWARGGTTVQYQLDVTDWAVVRDDYDWLLEDLDVAV